ncbi:MAG: PEGA domain-containing protein [Patescibacteria group bacterium]
MKTNKKSNSLTKITILIAIILMVVAYFFYNNNQYGNLQIQSPTTNNLSIFVDNQEKKLNESLNLKLKKGEHSIILSQQGYWPWTKTINIVAKEQTEINPFFIPQNASGFLIGKEDPEYYDILKLFRQTNKNPKALVKITNPTLLEKIKAIDFYKDREDVVIISVEEGVYALETTQENLQPIYKGINPLFVKKDDSTLYILDNNSLMLVAY